MMTYYLAILFGIIALIFSVLKFQIHSQKYFLLCNALDCFCFGLQFLLLAQYSGAFMSFLGSFGSIFALVFNKKISSKYKILYIVIFSILLYLVVPDVFSTLWKIFPVIGLLICRIAEMQKDDIRMRIMFIPSSILWLIYGIFTRAWPSVLAEVLGITSNCWGIQKIRRKNCIIKSHIL